MSFHRYADDTQLYIGTNASTLVHQVASIESCAQRVHNWFLSNGLHLNPSKSEAIVFSTQGPNLSKYWLNSFNPLKILGLIIRSYGPQGSFQFVLSILKSNDTSMKFHDFFAPQYVVYIPQISLTYISPPPHHRSSKWTPRVI